MLTRQDLEQREDAWFSPFAMRSSQSRGRAVAEDEHPYRTAYQRDRDRIIHTTPFRRLEYKTQVFVYSEGDHYRNRLTHSIEVAQIGRTLARALGCNEDLTEAICLAHDLGHPPFGHVGEATLNSLMQNYGGYDHQKQTYRILTELEHRYPEYSGLNLTYEVLEGVVKHDTDYDIVDARDYCPDERGTLECQLSNLADEIAYNTSDLDDGLRSGILDPDAVNQLPIAAITWESFAKDGAEQPSAEFDTNFRHDMTRHRFIRRLVGIQVTDVVTSTHARINESGIATLADLRRLPANVAGYSAPVQQANRELKKFLYDNFYRHFRVMRMATKAERLLRNLFDAYVAEPLQLPLEVQARVASSPEGLQRVVCDYLAGMTDRYAVQEYKRLYDPEERV
ncbi:MAG: deoxyguanosinetriphosphate triphosphohydrolase [Caldilineaceae bacterium]|nr:deoxyguanosinetriphosphate triphosphohydrolase [Caldilineaceae bacterium]